MKMKITTLLVLFLFLFRFSYCQTIYEKGAEHKKGANTAYEKFEIATSWSGPLLIGLFYRWLNKHIILFLNLQQQGTTDGDFYTDG